MYDMPFTMKGGGQNMYKNIQIENLVYFVYNFILSLIIYLSDEIQLVIKVSVNLIN